MIRQSKFDGNARNSFFFPPKIKCIQGISSNSSDDRVDRAFAFGAVESGLIPSQVKPMALKLVFTASLLDAQH